MTSFQTKYKLYPHRYVYTAPKKSTFTLRDLYRKTAPLTLKSCQGDRIQAHDCREPIIQDIQDSHQWDCYILAHGLNATCDSAKLVHQNMKKDLEKIEPDKLLFQIGNGLAKSGTKDGQFKWPRGLATTSSGSILVADTLNHRVQVFNQYGMLVTKFGQFGCKDAEFNEPTGVAVNLYDEVFVADSKNKRVQIFTRKKVFKELISTMDEPCSIAVDTFGNVIIGSYKRTVEIYRKHGQIVNRFSIHTIRTKEPSAVHVAVCDLTDTIIVSDPGDRMVKTFNYTGELLNVFEPEGYLDGLACKPAGLFVLKSGNICLCDSLNHMVNEYSSRGECIRNLIGPTDDAGSVQQCTVGPEGHLLVTEYSVDGMHSLKIFRFKDCECHRRRPGSTRRPATTPKINS